MAVPQQYQHTTRITVRFGDLDAMGHLNHTKYLTYMEQARIFYIRDVLGFEDDWERFNVILAKATCDYHLPVMFPDVVTIYTRCSRIGGKSFDFSYVLDNQNGETVATGLTVLVAFDYQTQQSMTIPQVWRDAIVAYEDNL